MANDEVWAALRHFSATLTGNFAVAETNPAQAEDQLKGPMQTFLRNVGEVFGRDVEARTEALTGGGVRPDLGVSVDGLLVGHVELKAPGKGARPQTFADRHDREQFKRLADHPNLVYTDGNEWALYRLGTRIGDVVSSRGDVRTDAYDAYDRFGAGALALLLGDFLSWQPLVPSSPRALAELLAPLTRLLRTNVVEAVATSGSALSELADEWRRFFFPDANDAQFADAYAQTVTYALLLARVEGGTDMHPAAAAAKLDARNGLLAQVLRFLEDPAARAEVDVAVGLLERAIGAVDPDRLTAKGAGVDLWLYFYEDFLAAYDPRLRRQNGVYYTPFQVVRAQVTLVGELLRDRFGKPLGFADDGVTVLDPAVGTGTYLLAALDAGLDAVEAAYGAGQRGARASLMAENLRGFERMIGPYAVAHLRLSQRIAEAGGQVAGDGVRIYLTDTLESPHLAPQGLAHVPLFHRKLAEENERARRVKAEVPILVCIGNPPYFRQVIAPHEEGVERLGGWVREGDESGAGIMGDFLAGVPGVHAKNLYNLYVYFWRWALWKVYENAPGRGVVSFITASSYLRGPGFAGMRRFMRETFDELWIVDLGGESRGARKSENVFAIQTPVAIAVGVRDGEAQPKTPARVRYARIDGTRQEKYDALEAIGSFGEMPWQDCFSGWTEPFLPDSAADFFAWPPLTDLFPWQHSGMQFKRTWPISPDRETLEARWRALVGASPERRTDLFRETRDRKATVLKALPRDEPVPAVTQYAYRSLDRQFCLADERVGDFLRPALWHAFGPRQIHMTSLLTGLLGPGPAAIATHLMPDMHHFRGSFGAKHVIPLWRDANASEPNVTIGLLDALAARIERPVEPQELFAYCYAILQAPGYVERFGDELEVPGPRIPLTADATLFAKAVELGSRLIWLHTFAERLVPAGEKAGRVPQGLARSTQAIGATPDAYPREHRYDPKTRRLHVGHGVFEPVPPEVRSFSVSGLDVIGSWLGYRMRDGAGRRSSPLDGIRPQTWPPAFTEELLRVLWTIEHTVELRPALDKLLKRIVAGEMIQACELPEPTDAERAAP